MSATWGKPSVRSRCCAAVGEKPASGSSPSTRSVGEAARRPRAPSDDRAVLRGADEQPADVLVLAQRRDEPRVVALDLLQREPARLAHEVDEPEVARAEDDDVAAGDVLLVRALRAAAAAPRATACAGHRLLLVARLRTRSPRPLPATARRGRRGRSRCAAGTWRPGSGRGRRGRRSRRAAARSGGRARCGRSARRAAQRLERVRRARAPSGARPRRSSRTSRRRPGARASCPSAPRRR